MWYASIQVEPVGAIPQTFCKISLYCPSFVFRVSFRSGFEEL